MIRRVAFGALLAMPALWSGHQSAPQTQRPIFRADVNAVLVDVVVTDGHSSVPNLTAADFDVLDNGVKQTVSDVDYGRLPIDVRIVFDTSGSVSDAQLAKHVRAMAEVGGVLKSGDRCEAWSFARRSHDVVPLSEPPIDAHLTRVGSDATSFFDAVSMAMITAPRPGRRQLTIVLTDGFDNSSFFDQATLMREAQHTDAVVYTISPPLPSFAPSPMVNLGAILAGGGIVTVNGAGVSAGPTPSMPKVLDAVAKVTGGRLMLLDAKGDIAASFIKAIDEFRQSYVLHYSPEGVAPEGWHALTVTVRGNKKYTVRAKQGYEGGR